MKSKWKPTNKILYIAAIFVSSFGLLLLFIGGEVDTEFTPSITFIGTVLAILGLIMMQQVNTIELKSRVKRLEKGT